MVVSVSQQREERGWIDGWMGWWMCDGLQVDNGNWLEDELDGFGWVDGWWMEMKQPLIQSQKSFPCAINTNIKTFKFSTNVQKCENIWITSEMFFICQAFKLKSFLLCFRVSSVRCSQQRSLNTGESVCTSSSNTSVCASCVCWSINSYYGDQSWTGWMMILFIR